MAEKPRVPPAVTSTASAVSLPFQDAIEHHRQKVNLPTESWRDLQRGAHARAFAVAGAAKEALLVDFRQAVDDALAQGLTAADFRKQFDAIVATHGWDHTGTAGRRARVIYDTNLRTAYQTGRYRQQQATTKTRPYWRYRHGGSAHPRKEHQAWDGLVLHHTDAWWAKHYPPNGFGCTCRVESLSERDLRRLGLTVREAPTAPDDTRGIDEGWDYSVGEAAYGKRIPKADFDAIPKNRITWEPLEQVRDTDERELPAPDVVLAPLPAPPLPNTTDPIGRLKEVLGGDEASLATPGGGVVNVNATSLGGYIGREDKGRRARFVPLIPEILTDPAEVWQSFERHADTGRVVLRTRYLRVFRENGTDLFMLVSVDASAGQMTAYNVVPMKTLAAYQSWRRGRLLFRGE